MSTNKIKYDVAIVLYDADGKIIKPSASLSATHVKVTVSSTSSKRPTDLELADAVRRVGRLVCANRGLSITAIEDFRIKIIGRHKPNTSERYALNR